MRTRPIKLHDVKFARLRLTAFLTPRERMVLQFRYGVDEPKSLTTWEIGKWFGVTGTYVEQIEMKALRKLKVSPYRPSVATLMEDGSVGRTKRRRLSHLEIRQELCRLLRGE